MGMYKKNEKKVMFHLVEAVKYFNRLKHAHPCHKKDFTDGIHKSQNVIIHRIIQRIYPKEFPTYKS